jgi:hypothetical protein
MPLWAEPTTWQLCVVSGSAGRVSSSTAMPISTTVPQVVASGFASSGKHGPPAGVRLLATGTWIRTSVRDLCRPGATLCYRLCYRLCTGL